jgi:hypothetical protein
VLDAAFEETIDLVSTLVNDELTRRSDRPGMRGKGSGGLARS